MKLALSTVMFGLTFTLILAAFSPNTTKFVAMFILIVVMPLNCIESYENKRKTLYIT